MKLSINNFRGINTFETEIPTKILALTGPCGSGKSSVLKAVRFLFTGDVKDDMIQKGEKKAQVTLEFDNGDVLSRIREPGRTKCRINNKAAAMKAADEFLIKQTGVPSSAYNPVMGCDFLNQMNTKDMSSFLMNILPLSVDIQTVLKYCHEIDPELDTPMEELIKEALPEENISFTALATAYNLLFDNRTVQNRLVNDLRSKTSTPPSLLPKETEEELDQRLYELAGLEEKKKQAEAAKKAYESLLKTYEAAVKKKADLEKALSEYKDVKAPDKAVLEQNTKERQQFYDAVINTEAVIASIKNNIALFEKTLTSLDQPVCPLSDMLVCKTDKKPLKDQIEKALKENKDSLKKGEEFLERCRQQIIMRDKDIEEYHRQELKFNEKSSLEKQLQELVIPEKPEKPKVPQTDADIEKEKQEISLKKKLIFALQINSLNSL